MTIIRQPTMDNYVYIHVCCLNQWQEIVASLMHKIKESRLYDDVKEIRCGVVGEYGDATVLNDPKIVIVGHSNDVKLYETSTLNLLHEHAQQEDFNALYIHTKGVSHGPTAPDHANVVDWVNYLSHFNISRHRTCRRYLQTHDGVGVNLLGTSPQETLHYSGNFWWSKSPYIRKLDRCVQSSHNAPEFWLTETRMGSYISLWNSGVNHYDDPYPIDRYAGQSVMRRIPTSWPPVTG